MFKKLKRNILILNVSLISILLLSSFISIYLITRNNVLDDVDSDIRRAFFSWEDTRKRIEEEGDEFNNSSLNDYLKNTKYYDFLETRLGGSYLIWTNDDRSILKTVGFYNISEGILEDAISSMNFGERTEGIILHGDIKWAYRISQAEEGYNIIIKDITNRMSVLNNLVLTSMVIFFVTMVLVVFISIYLTNKSAKPLDMAYRRQKQFVSDASHELRTPLASINANTDLILAKNYIRPAERKWLEYIKKETSRMSNLTGDLLYLAELDEKYLDSFKKEAVDISTLANTYLLGMEGIAFERGVSLTGDVQDGIIIKGDSEKISQVFVILLENAMNHTPEKGIIKLEVSKVRQNIELRVTNTGSYISEDKIERIFDRFYRADESRGGKSTSHGLGLSIAKSIVERHGGSIGCSSEPEGKTSFIVKLKSL